MTVAPISDADIDPSEYAPGDASHARVELWLSPMPAVLDAERSAHYQAMLSADEKQRWQRFLRAEDRDRFLHARALTRTVLARYLGDLEPAALSFSQGSWGKPTLAHPPRASPLYFNLSHTDGMAVLAVTRTGEVGVDVEAIDRNVEPLQLSARFFAAAEHAQIAGQSGDAQRERFFRLWTLKEAYLKARGLGLHMALDSFAFDCDGDAIRLQESDAVRSEGHWCFAVRSHGEFRMALALLQSSAAAVPMQVSVREGQPGDAFRGL